MIQAWDRLRIRLLCKRHPGLEIHPDASTNLAGATYALGKGARLRIGPGVVTERVRGELQFRLGEGAEVEIGAGTWLRTEVGRVHLIAFEGARLRIGSEGFLNGCHLSTKRSLVLGRRVWVGPGSRIFDSDQHDLDAERRERFEPVTIEDHVWIASDVTVLRGVHIGEHAVIGARALVTHDVPPHTLVLSQPARAAGSIGDRSRVR